MSNVISLDDYRTATRTQCERCDQWIRNDDLSMCWFHCDDCIETMLKNKIEENNKDE